MRLLLSFVMLTFGVGCSDASSEYFDPRGLDYAGQNACISCHKQIYDQHSIGAHFNSTASGRSMAFDAFSKQDAKSLFTFDSGEFIGLEKSDSLYYMSHHKPGALVTNYPVDMVFGHHHAQTFGFWKNGNLFELPVSYYSDFNQWGTSPTFPSDHPYFARRIPKDCFACHTSNASEKNLGTKSTQRSFMNTDVSEKINPKTIVHGIDCERCHGPGKTHANAPASVKMPRFSQMTRQQRLDACALCHSGNDGIKMRSRFEFLPGNALATFYSPSPNPDMDVHGNQYGLLTQSKCFIKSETMDCMTCHDPHKDTSAQSQTYNQSCIKCHVAPKHSGQTLSMNPKLPIAKNCVTCHMPVQGSQAIQFKLPGDKEMRNYQLRTHKIGVYEAKKASIKR